MRAQRIIRAAGLCAALALLGVPASPESGRAELLADLDDGQVAMSSLPHSIVTVGEQSFFTVHLGAVGRELWVTDGTEDGTRLVLDIVPGAAGSSPSSLIAHKDGVVFFARTDQSYLWRSDGTVKGSFALSDRPSPEGLSSGPLATAGRTIFFTATEDRTGSELWVSRGRPKDARLVRDLTPGPDSSEIVFVGTLEKRLVFRVTELSADGFPTGDSYFITDGRAKGTHKLVDLPRSPYPLRAAQLGGQLFFTAGADTPQGTALWRTDGTPSGTARVVALAGGSDSLSISGVSALGDRILVLIGVARPELWSTDGTAAGTARIATFEDYVRFPPVVGDEAIFFTINASGVWRSDGTAAGTFLIDPVDRLLSLTPVGPDVYFQVGTSAWFRNAGLPGTSVKMRDGSAIGITVGGDGILFSGGRLEVQPNGFRGLSLPGLELYTSDGTPEGTRLLKNIRPDVASSDPKAFVRLGDEVVFRASTNELWRTDGTTLGTELIRRFESERFNALGSPFRLGSALLFSADAASIGFELWRSDGTPRGTEVVSDLNVGPDSSFPHLFTRAGKSVFFVATEADRGRQLWTSDGTRSGTFRLSDIEPRPSFVYGITVFEEKAFMIARLPAEPLWRSDGSPSGTTAIPVEEGLLLNTAPVANDTGVFFTAFHEDSGYDLWRVTPDGSGVELVSDMTPGPEGVTLEGPRWLTPLGSQLFFVADDGTSGLELFVTDGTAEGTRLVRDIRPGAAEGSCEPPIEYGGFPPPAPGGQDGEPCPVRGAASIAPANLLPAGGKLFFSADDGWHGRELWVSDGSRDGTRMLVDAFPGRLSSQPRLLREIDGLLLFQMRTPEHGEELWVSDGTRAGTVRLADDMPGSGGAEPTAGAIARGHLVYGAHREDVGRELFSIPWPPEAIAPLGDVAIGGARLVIRDRPGRGSELAATARDRAISPPAEGSRWAPTEVGATLTLHNPETGEFERFELPVEGWIHRNTKRAEGARFVFRQSPVPDRGCYAVNLSPGRITARCGGPGEGFTLNEESQGELALELSLGDGLRYCMRFGGVLTDVGATPKRPGQFKAREALAPEGCLEP